MTGVIVTKSLAPYRLDFYEELNRCKGVSTVVCVPKIRAFDHPWSDLVGGRDLEVVETPAIPFPGWLNTLARHLGFGGQHSAGISPALVRELNKRNPDFVIAHEASPYALTAIVWAAYRRKVVLQSSELGRLSGGDKMRGGTKTIHSLASRFISGRIANSREALEGVGISRPTILCPHAVKESSSYSLTESKSEAIEIVFVGALIERKGLDVLIEALRQLDSRNLPAFRLRVAGTGNQALYEGLAKAAGMEEKVIFEGFVEGKQLDQFYGRAHIFCLPTRFDTYAVVVHEAAMQGLPLIVSDAAGAARVMVEEGKNGFVFRSQDPQHLAKKLQQLIVDQALRTSFRTGSRKLAEFFSAGNSARKSVDFLDKLKK